MWPPVRRWALLILDIGVLTDTGRGQCVKLVLEEVITMAKRWKMSRRKSRGEFRRSAQAVHPKNDRGGRVMRGGIRL